MRVVDPGHIYELTQLGTKDTVQLQFIKRSGGTVQYEQEWPGLQTQEVLRALIDRTKYLNEIIPCQETLAALEALREALFQYEVRALRRKEEKANRTDQEHWDHDPPGARVLGPYYDIPFLRSIVEDYPIGEDGHIIS